MREGEERAYFWFEILGGNETLGERERWGENENLGGVKRFVWNFFFFFLKKAGWVRASPTELLFNQNS
jgi:hypothetical protein